jgi:hypothetical protein
LVKLVQDEELEETLIDLNISQRSCEKKTNWKGGAHLSGLVSVKSLHVT